jgi:hypothetical protein
MLLYQKVNQKIETETQMIESARDDRKEKNSKKEKKQARAEKLRAMDASTPLHPMISQYIPYSMPIFLYVYIHTHISLSLIIIIISHITSHITSQYRRIPHSGVSSFQRSPKKGRRPGGRRCSGRRCPATLATTAAKHCHVRQGVRLLVWRGVGGSG